MIACREFVEFVARYLDGELAAAEQAEFDAHMAACPWCRAYLETYRETIALGKVALEANDEPVPEEVPEELVQAILAARRKA